LFPYHRSKFELSIFLFLNDLTVKLMVYLWGNWDLNIQRVWLDSFLLTELTSPYCCICPISGLLVHRLDRWKFDRWGIPYFCIYSSFPWFNVFNVFTTWGMSIWLGLWCLTALSTIFQLYRDSQFHWWSTRRKLPTCCKSPTKIMLYRVHLAWVVFELTTFVMIDTDCEAWYYYSSTHC
jgi:hypothetical protein